MLNPSRRASRAFVWGSGGSGEGSPGAGTPFLHTVHHCQAVSLPVPLRLHPTQALVTGRERTVADWRQLFAAAGFEIESIAGEAHPGCIVGKIVARVKTEEE
jgi:hypothetical protein